MKKYVNDSEIIISLHERGFCEDFQLTGDNLLWLQDKIFIRPHEFCILECHHLLYPTSNKTELIVFGVLAIAYNIKGILLNDYRSYTTGTPKIIEEKMPGIYFQYVHNISRPYLLASI